MSTRDPGKKVDFVEDAVSKVRTDIRLVSHRMVFFARVGEETIEDKDGVVVRKWAAEQMKKMRAVEWTAVIIINHSSEQPPKSQHLNGRNLESTAARIDLEVRRTYLAKVGEALRELDWSQHAKVKDPMGRVDKSFVCGCAPADVLKRLPYRQPDEKHWKLDDRVTVLPYDAETWNGLVLIVQGIERSRKELKKILGKADLAQTFLAAIGSGKVELPSAVPVALVGAGGEPNEPEADEQE